MGPEHLEGVALGADRMVEFNANDLIIDNAGSSAWKVSADRLSWAFNSRFRLFESDNKQLEDAFNIQCRDSICSIYSIE